MKLVGTYRTNFNVTILSSDGHTTKTTMARGQDVAYEFSAPEGRTIEKVTLNGEPIELTEDSYTINAISDDAVFVVTLDKVEPEVVYVQPEHVTVYLEVGDHVAVAHKVAKEQDATVNVAPTENWILSKLTLNDADVTENVATDGNYTIPAASLKEDANLKAEFAYNGTPMFDFTTSVDGIVDGCDYKVYSDNNDLVIENVPANAKVAVYSVAGLKIAEESNLGDTDIIRISLNPGVYVVIINNDALKVKH